MHALLLPPLTLSSPQALLHARAEFDGDERKLKFNSLGAGSNDVTAEDVEAYKMTKSRPDDPMANFKDDDDDDAAGSDSDSDSGSSSDSDSSSGGRKKRGSAKRKAAKAPKASSSSRKGSDKRRRRHSDSD